MTLKEYLYEKRMTAAEFAALIDGSASGVRKWMQGARTPRPAQIAAIEKATDGQVTASDFFPSPGAQAA